jgi:PAS domain S-box-containing protein
MNHDDYEGLARALFEESSEAQFLLDPETGKILDANAAAQRLCGLTLRAVRDTPLAELFRLTVGDLAAAFPLTVRRVQLPYAERGCLIRTFQEAGVPVDVTITRLNVKPTPLALLWARRADVPPAPSPAPPAGRLRSLVLAVPDCLWSAKIPEHGEGRYHYLSPVVELIAGRPADYFGGELARWRGAIHPEDRPVWDDALEQRRAGKATQDEYRLAWPDGSVRWVRDHARAVHTTGARSVWLYGVYTDVTGRRQAETPLRRLAELVDTAEDAIIGQTLDGLIVDWNRGAERLYGYTREEVRSKPVLRLFAPDGLKDYAEALQRLRRGEPSEPYVAAQVRKGGERIKVSMRISPIGGSPGSPDGISIIARGVAEAAERGPAAPVAPRAAAGAPPGS